MTQSKSILMDIANSEEPWTVVHLTNGDIIKLKTVILAVHLILDEHGQPIRLPDDSAPQYAVNSTLVIAMFEKADRKKLS